MSVPSKACIVLTCSKSVVENAIQNVSSVSSKLLTLNKLNNNFKRIIEIIGGLGEWACLKRVHTPRDILYLLLTSQPYFLVVSTGKLY